MIPLEQALNVADIAEANTVVIQTTEEQHRHLAKLIEEYDHRPPFDIAGCKQNFSERTEWQLQYMKEQLKQFPAEICDQIIDVRILALGYCTSKIYKQIKQFSLENKKQTEQTMEELAKVRRLQAIPESIGRDFNFHDCRVLQLALTKEKNCIFHLDPSGGFTENNKVTFVNAEIVKEEPNIVGASWIYDEIYSTSDGYEVHMLFDGGTLSELILNCEHIIIEKD